MRAIEKLDRLRSTMAVNVLKQINNKRAKHTHVLVKADKGKTIVISDEDKYERKNRWLPPQEPIPHHKKKSTDNFQQQIQQVVLVQLLNR